MNFFNQLSKLKGVGVFIFITFFMSCTIIPKKTVRPSIDLVNELYGFKLNQFKEVPINELGKPLEQGYFDDGFRYEFYLINPDSSAYVVFEYSNLDQHILNSIQVNSKDENIVLGFKGLKFGMTSDEVISKLGPPSSKEDTGIHGYRWEYDSSNYSIEINPEGLLSSVKILEEYPIFYPKVDITKIPSLKTVTKALQSNNKEMSAILSPGLEVYKGEKLLFFQHSWKHEIEDDKSSIYAVLREAAKGLEKVSPNNMEEYEENMRMVFNQDTKHVLKFKKHEYIEEIVMNWEFGRYLIWEVRLKAFNLNNKQL